MAVITKVSVEAKYIEAVETTQFTVPAAEVAILDAVWVTNTGTTTELLNLSLVASGDAAGDANRAIKDKPLRPKETYLCPEVLGQAMNAGGFISAVSTLASALNIRVTTRIVT